MANERIVYIEQKTRGNEHLQDRGPAFIARVELSKTGRSLYFKGLTLQRAAGGYGPGNHICLETRDSYWVSGVKKRGTNRHWAGGGDVVVEVTQEELDEELRR